MCCNEMLRRPLDRNVEILSDLGYGAATLLPPCKSKVATLGRVRQVSEVYVGKLRESKGVWWDRRCGMCQRKRAEPLSTYIVLEELCQVTHKRLEFLVKFFVVILVSRWKGGNVNYRVSESVYRGQRILLSTPFDLCQPPPVDGQIFVDLGEFPILPQVLQQSEELPLKVVLYICWYGA